MNNNTVVIILQFNGFHKAIKRHTFINASNDNIRDTGKYVK